LDDGTIASEHYVKCNSNLGQYRRWPRQKKESEMAEDLYTDPIAVGFIMCILGSIFGFIAGMGLMALMKTASGVSRTLEARSTK
jgi:hypothetical protein